MQCRQYNAQRQGNTFSPEGCEALGAEVSRHNYNFHVKINGLGTKIQSNNKDNKLSVNIKRITIIM